MSLTICWTIATNAYASNFMGNQVGYQATSANNSNFFVMLVVRHQVLE
jgi:hypothetical protein